MNKKKKIIISTIISIFVLLISFIGVFAYYEYYGQYSSILNIDGTIKLDAFDVLYPDLKNDTDGSGKKTYGCTPENPYVIDNVTRLRNLIRLNNSGKLQKSKEKYNIDKFYFCLQFDAQTVSQILNLQNEGEFSSLGNNEYPFVDELSGIVYGVEYSSGYMGYYSGCLPIYKVQDNKVYVNGIETNLDPNDYSSLTVGAEYICTNSKYDSTKTTSDTMCFDDTWEEQFILVSDTTIIHQVISNETIVATDNQIDIGFVSNIGDGGYIHDLVLYNETIIAKEEGLFDAFLADLSALFNGHPRVKTDTLEERHIGIFAGHIDEGGNAKNISVGGNCKINIDTEKVNYFSNYTTVGYIDSNAMIGGKLFSIIATDATLDGNIAGVLFADEIYSAAIDQSVSSSLDNDNANHYALTDISAQGGWPGTEGTHFEYGSFTFLLSNSDDTLSSIWSDSSSLTLLGDSGYKINGSVLYCNDEYRYQANNGINQAAASVKESAYNGITKLDNSGNVIDQGKYIIVAHIDNYYYSLKIAATEDSSGTVSYYFDTTDKINVTDFLTTTGTLYQSSLWEVSTPSATPIFKNCRFESEYLKGYAGGNVLTASNNLTDNSSQATGFAFNLSDSRMYFVDSTSGIRYYLNFDENDNSFYFSNSASTAIEIYKVSDGYNLDCIKEFNNIVDLGSYLVVATNGSSNYLVGLDYDAQAQTITTDVTTIAASSIESLAPGIIGDTVTMTTTEYETYKNFIWRADVVGNNQLTFIDTMSSSLYLSRNGANIVASNTALNWIYGTQNNTTLLSSLSNGGYYLTYGNNGIGTTQTQSYRIYLLKITPQDETPPYITYDGAKYLDATASTVEIGTYSVVATAENGEQYVIGVNNNSISTTNRFIQATTYNSSYTYYSRTGNGTTNSPYVYTVANISEYTNADVTNQATLTNAIAQYSTLYYANSTYEYTEEFIIYNENYYTANTNDNSINNFQRGTAYYTSFNNNGQSTHYRTFMIEPGVTYYTRSGTNGNYTYTQTNSFSKGNTYYSRKAVVQYTQIPNNTYNANYTYYYKTLDSVNYYYDFVYASNPEKYEWNVADSTDSTAVTTANLVFKNINYSAYYLNGTSVSTTSSVLYYDAINQQVFYYSGEVKTYILANIYGTIITSTTVPTTMVCLYKAESKYTYNNVQRITSGIKDFQYSSKVYFISTGELTNSSNNSYLIGKDDPLNASFTGNTNKNYTALEYFSMANKYEYSNGTITTTEDLDNFSWLYDTACSDATAYANLYLSGYETQKGNSSYHYYIGVSSVGGKRDLVITKRTNSNVHTKYVSYTRDSNYWYCGTGSTSGKGGSYAITGFWQGTINGDYAIIFKAAGNSYFMAKGDTDRSMTIDTYASNLNVNLGLTSSYSSPYFYACDKPVKTTILTLISSKGDTLEENIHYAIAAQDGDNYYAMTYDTEISNNIFGTDMTNQISNIERVGTYLYSTTIPSNCDWVQVSNNYELRFEHYITSTDASLNFLSFLANSIGITNISSSSSYTSVNACYYDIVNKRLSFVLNNTTYYVTYNSETGSFGVSTSILDAATIVMVRYTPSYKVERVTSLTDSLDSGQYIFAGHSVNGYTALGTNGNILYSDLTNYLQSDLSEADYLAIQEYIFNQVYYSNIENSNYETDCGSGYVNFLIENAANLSSFVSYSTEFKAFSSSAKWRFYVQNGMWKLISYEKMGTESGGQYGINYTATNTTSNLKINDTVEAVGNYISGVNQSSANEERGIQIAIYSSSDLTNRVTSLGTGTYIIFALVGSYWYMLYLNGSSLDSVQIGQNLNNLNDKITSSGVSNYTVTATIGPSNYGYYLRYGSNYYLISDGTNLSVTQTQNTNKTNTTMHWKYNFNAQNPSKSYLFTVYEATVNNFLGVSGSKVTTDGSATYLYTVNYTNSVYSLGNIATSVTQGNRYAIVIFKDGNYYIVSRATENGLDITYNSYGAGLPNNISEYEVFNGVSLGSSRYSFTQSVGGQTRYLIIDTDKTIVLAEDRNTCYFTYSGSNPTATPSKPTRIATNSCTYSWYLFRVSKNDDLDNSTDVVVTLPGHVKATASLSVIQSDQYAIVAESNGVYYALSFKDKDTIIPLDVTKTMEEALNGANIRLYSASVFEQLGSEYSLIFNSKAFGGSFYYLLDGTYEDRNVNSPVVDPVSLYDSEKTYYTINLTVCTDGLSQSLIEEGNYYYYVSGYYIKATTYNSNIVYYTLTEEPFGGAEFEAGVTYYEKKTTGGYERAYEFKENVTFYTYNNGVYVEEENLTSFNNLTTYYVLTSNPTYIAVNSKTADVSTIEDDYIWTIYTYNATGTSGYVIGWYSSDLDNTSYLYFNSTSKQFELTTDMSTAYQANSLVQIYRLGEEITTAETFKTFNVYLEQDGVTILSFPLNEVTDASKYERYDSINEGSVSQENGTTMDVIPGEYMIATKVGQHEYALTMNSDYDLSYVDVSLVFDGSYVKDENGYYCVSINTKYLWNQMIAESSLTVNDNVVSGLQFQNDSLNQKIANGSGNYNITITITDSTTGASQIMCNGQYLAFSEGTGFTWTSTAGNAATMYIYSVGASAPAVSDDTVLSYTYYSSSLQQVNYSYFQFSKFMMDELPNYANPFGEYDYSTGWYIDTTNLLTEVNSSVYFATSASTNSANFIQCSYNYEYTDGVLTEEKNLSYYAPKGTASFAISDADVSLEDPVYLNVIVSTELYDNSLSSIRNSRYLSLWKVDTFNAETGNATNCMTAADYASVLSGMFYTPNAAIPLANHYDETEGTTSKSLVKVGANGDYYYLSDYGYDHLIAHTFIITEPGIYYLGTTSGTVAFSYLSIDKMRDVDDGADSSQSISEDFTIDVVWGELGTSSTFAQLNTTSNYSDAAIGTIAYVGREDGANLTWVHSNVYPEFINGTPGVWSPDTSETYYIIDVTEAAYIPKFYAGVTYYTKSGNNYIEVTGNYDVTATYYTYNEDTSEYTLVHSGFANGTKFYYIAEVENELYFHEASTNNVVKKYYTITTTAHTFTSSDEFNAHVAYFTVEDGNYKLTYNPCDYMDLSIERIYNSASSIDVSVEYSTYDCVYFYGYGLMYINSNKSSNKAIRTITIHYTEYDGD